MSILVVIIILLVLIIIYSHVPQDATVRVKLEDGRVLQVLKRERSMQAARLLGSILDKIIILLARLKESINKYSEYPVLTRRIRALLKHFNSDEVIEKTTGNPTALTVGKGRKMYICLRNANGAFIDENIIMFVVLHECAHVMHYDGWGHETNFWVVFKFLLGEAISAGIYTPVNYYNSPTMYCGLKVAYNPYYDAGLPSALY